ncbi:hypothetical protein BGX29_005586, partial [Mortierella sp. GBA35]
CPSALSRTPGKPQGREPDSTSTELILSHVEEAEEDLMAKKPPTKFYNLAVKQNAVYQPTLKRRRWLEQRKQQSIEGSGSISRIETELPRRHGPEASIKDYAQSLQKVEGHLNSFYGNV